MHIKNLGEQGQKGNYDSGRWNSMTKEDLEKLRFLRAEIDLLNEELHHLPMVTDKVTGSMTEFPYIKRSITIQGVDAAAGQQLRNKIADKVVTLQWRLDQMEDWLDGVTDPEIRTILRLRYRSGKSWTEISRELKYADESVPRKRMNRFLKMTETSEGKPANMVAGEK